MQGTRHLRDLKAWRARKKQSRDTLPVVLWNKSRGDLCDLLCRCRIHHLRQHEAGKWREFLRGLPAKK